MNYSATTKATVQCNNTSIQPDNFSCIIIRNIGDDSAIINGNIPLAPGEVYDFTNRPNVIITEQTDLRFLDMESSQKLLVELRYFKPI